MSRHPPKHTCHVMPSPGIHGDRDGKEQEGRQEGRRRPIYLQLVVQGKLSSGHQENVTQFWQRHAEISMHVGVENCALVLRCSATRGVQYSSSQAQDSDTRPLNTYVPLVQPPYITPLCVSGKNWRPYIARTYRQVSKTNRQKDSYAQTSCTCRMTFLCTY